MISALHRVPRKLRRARAQEWARRSQAAQAAARMERGPDAETIRRRAMEDARGTVLRHGVTFFGDGRVVAWEIRRAVRGRIDQLEVVVDGRVWLIGGRRAVRQRAGVRV